MKKKILFFISSLEDGGAQRVICALSNELIDKKYDVEILKYYEGENVFSLNKKIKVTSVENKNIISNIFWIRKYFRNNADVVISFLAPFNIIALLANFKNKTPIIVADRNDPNKVPGNKIIRLLRDCLYRLADAIVVQTENNKNYFNYIKDKCFIIKNPIDLKGKEGQALKTKKDKVIVSVGRLEQQKNQAMLIKAFSKVHEQYKDYQLIIYGEGSYREQLEKLINELNLKEFVKLPGSSNNVFDDISNAELFVLSSNYEGMPNALAEAMCLGLPCISTNVSGSNELIINEENGYLININDEDALASTIKELLDNKTQRNKIARNAIKLVDSLNIDTIVKEWETIIGKM